MTTSEKIARLRERSLRPADRRFLESLGAGVSYRQAAVVDEIYARYFGGPAPKRPPPRKPRVLSKEENEKLTAQVRSEASRPHREPTILKKPKGGAK